MKWLFSRLNGYSLAPSYVILPPTSMMAISKDNACRHAPAYFQLEEVELDKPGWRPAQPIFPENIVLHVLPRGKSFQMKTGHFG